MRRPERKEGLKGLRQAFDEVRFGAQRTLNLRDTLPTAAAATSRTEAWLRQQQVERAGEVLIVTGRGNQSDGGIPVVREAVIRLLLVLRRRGVVSGHEEHTPGSFVVTLAGLLGWQGVMLLILGQGGVGALVSATTAMAAN